MGAYVCASGAQVGKDPQSGDAYCYTVVNGKEKRTSEQPQFRTDDELEQMGVTPGSSVTGQVQTDPSRLEGLLAGLLADSGDKNIVKETQQTDEGELDITSTTDVESGQTTTKKELTKTEPVLKSEGGYYDRLDRLGGGEGPGIYVSEYEASNYPKQLMGTTGARGNPVYDEFQQGLVGFFGQKFMSYTTDQSAWNAMIDIARVNGVSPWDLLKNGQASYKKNGPPGSGGGGGGGGGTRYSYTEMNEADIRVLANSMSEEFIGRRIDDKEFQRLLKRVRKEEGKSPTITTTSGKTTRTKKGITNEERKEVMAEILNEHPEYRDYQMGEGALEYTREYLAEQKQKAAL